MESAADLVPADHPLRALADHLAGLRGGRAFVRPADFDVTAVRAYIGWIHLLDVLPTPAGADYRFAVYAGHLAELTGSDYQGQRVSAIKDTARRAHLVEVLDRVCRSGTPEFTRDQTRGPLRTSGTQRFDRLAWPMSTDGAAIDRLLVCIRPA